MVFMKELYSKGSCDAERTVEIDVLHIPEHTCTLLGFEAEIVFVAAFVMKWWHQELSRYDEWFNMLLRFLHFPCEKI